MSTTGTRCLNAVLLCSLLAACGDDSMGPDAGLSSDATPSRDVVLSGDAARDSDSSDTGIRSDTLAGDTLASCGPPPEAPRITSPASGSLEVRADNFLVQAETSATAMESEVELVRLTSSGERVVWRSNVVAGADPAIDLADGMFVDGEAFEMWKRYAIQARSRRGPECSWSDWSERVAFRSDDGSTLVFADGPIREIRLTISPESFAAIDAESQPMGCTPLTRSYYPGDVSYEGEVFAGAGIRGKGGCGSSRSLGGKSSFKINLSWDDPSVAGCPATRRLHGLKRITLNNQVQDGSYIHERLTYHLYAMLGIPAVRTAPIRVVVNDDLWGLYLNVESIDRRFLTRWFPSNDGMLYEGTYDCDLLSRNVPSTEDGIACLTKKFDTDECSSAPAVGADPTTYGPLREMTAALEALDGDNFYPAINEVFDYDLYLSLLAIDTVIDHFDSYHYRTGNNYRVYHEPTTDRWTLIPQGVDQTFVNRSIDPFEDDKALLASRCIADAACATAFVERLREVLAVFEGADLIGMTRRIQEEIRADVEADPRREITAEEWELQVGDLVRFIEERPTELRGMIADAGY